VESPVAAEGDSYLLTESLAEGEEAHCISSEEQHKTSYGQ
jgi:hypothetical protein